MMNDSDHLITRPTTVLGIIALLGVAVFAITCGAVQFLRTDYDWLRVPLSFYALGPYGEWLQVSYFALAVGLVAIGIGWYRALDRKARSAAPLLLFALSAIALCVTAIALTDLPNGHHTVHGYVHLVAAQTTFLCVTIAMLLQSLRLRIDPRWRRHFRFAFALASIAFIALWIDALARTLPRGLAEKVVIALILAWLWRAGWHLFCGPMDKRLA